MIIFFCTNIKFTRGIRNFILLFEILPNTCKLAGKIQYKVSMPLPINNSQFPEQVIDRAVDLLIYEKRLFKNQRQILQAINQDLADHNFSENNFSLSKTLTRSKGGEYLKRVGSDIAPIETRRNIAEALILLLGKNHLVFSDGYFFETHNPEKKWGQLLTSVSDNFQRPTQFCRIIYDDLCALIKTAEKKVQILHTFIADIRQLDTAIREVIENNRQCEFEILIMSPSSQALFLRERGLSTKKNQTVNVESKCKENYRFFSVLATEFPGNVKFATYDEIPGVVLYRIDDHLRVGFIWNQRFSNEGAYYVAKYDPTNIFHVDLENHFNEMLRQYAREETFDHSFIAYFVREGDLKKMTLELNSKRMSARLTNMPHGLDFNGYYIEQSNHSCAFNFTNVYNPTPEYVGEKRVAQIQTNISRQTWNESDRLYIGQYTILANDGILHSNTILLVRHEENQKLTEERLDQIRLFLTHNPGQKTTEVNIPGDITSWNNLASRIKAQNLL